MTVMPESICPHTPGLPPRSCGECLFEGNYSLAPSSATKRRRPRPSTVADPQEDRAQ